MTGESTTLQLTLAAVLVAVFLLVVLRRPLGRLLSLLARTGAGLVFLALFSHVSAFLGVSLGVNLWNAAVLGVLGVPGFGLLLMLHWLLGA